MLATVQRGKRARRSDRCRKAGGLSPGSWLDRGRRREWNLVHADLTEVKEGGFLKRASTEGKAG